MTHFLRPVSSQWCASLRFFNMRALSRGTARSLQQRRQPYLICRLFATDRTKAESARAIDRYWKTYRSNPNRVPQRTELGKLQCDKIVRSLYTLLQETFIPPQSIPSLPPNQNNWENPTIPRERLPPLPSESLQRVVARRFIEVWHCMSLSLNTHSNG